MFSWPSRLFQCSVILQEISQSRYVFVQIFESDRHSRSNQHANQNKIKRPSLKTSFDRFISIDSVLVCHLPILVVIHEQNIKKWVNIIIHKIERKFKDKIRCKIRQISFSQTISPEITRDPFESESGRRNFVSIEIIEGESPCTQSINMQPFEID